MIQPDLKNNPELYKLLTQQIDKLNSIIEFKNQEIQKLQQKLDESEQKNLRTLQENDKQLKVINENELNIKELNLTIQNHQSEIEKLTGVNAEFDQQISLIRLQNVRLNQTIDSQLQQNNEMKAQYLSLEGKLNLLNQTFTNQINELKKQNADQAMEILSYRKLYEEEKAKAKEKIQVRILFHHDEINGKLKRFQLKQNDEFENLNRKYHEHFQNYIQQMSQQITDLSNRAQADSEQFNSIQSEQQAASKTMDLTKIQSPMKQQVSPNKSLNLNKSLSANKSNDVEIDMKVKIFQDNQKKHIQELKNQNAFHLQQFEKKIRQLTTKYLFDFQEVQNNYFDSLQILNDELLAIPSDIEKVDIKQLYQTLQKPQKSLSTFAQSPTKNKQTPTKKDAKDQNAQPKTIWQILADKLPTSVNQADKEMRDKIFSQFDVNTNGFLSLAEIDKGIIDVLQCQQLFDCKPVIIRAFYAAKDKAKNKSQHGDDYIERYITGDRRLSREEFIIAIPLFQQWGIQIKDQNQAQQIFDQIDTNKGGFILFDEFCEWAIRQNLEQEYDHE